jgi:hypothetical protein
MLKSAILTITLLGVTLMGSLIMLVSFTSMNIFSNAMAQGYNDNYYGDNSYSKYPTDDKKYECRTGPFEGFFVSSVEFCELKNTSALKCDKCIEYYLNFAIDRNDVNSVLDAIRTALDLPTQGSIPRNEPLDLTKGADLWEICNAIEERLNTSMRDNDAVILENILQIAIDELTPPPGSPPTPDPFPSYYYSSTGIVNAIFDCIAEQINLVLPSS